MESNYDEDITENLFFSKLKEDYFSIFQKVIENGWIICVPRQGTFQDLNLAQDHIFRHILRPDDDLENNHFYTLNGIKVQVKNKVLYLENSVVGSYLGTRLLFQETFYTSDKFKYSVWCIEHPLDHRELSECTDDSLSTLTTVRECMDLMWTDVFDKKLLRDLKTNVEEFISLHGNLVHEPIEKQKNLVYALYQAGLEIILGDLKIQEKIASNHFFVKNLMIAVETYVLYGLQNVLSKSLPACMASEDAMFNKTLRNLQDVQPSDLGVRTDLEDNVGMCKLELSRLNSLHTVLGKIECLKRTVRRVSEGVSCISSDDLLPVLILLVIKISLPNWMVQLSFLKHFRFSANSTCEADQAGFLITSLEAAIEHIALGKIKRPLLFRIDKSDEQMQMFNIDKPITLAYLFYSIQQGDLPEVDRILSRTEGDSQKSNEFTFCHPLCTCDACEVNRRKTSSSPTVHTADDRGNTSLHVAASAGHITIVDFLLNRGANINERNSDGFTPLHYASMNGHQAAILLLLYVNANPSVADNRGNTPLHLASDRGHEGCVKALLYFAEQTRIPFDVNSRNYNGDVPLHYASKWGYRAIVQILLEYDANVGAKNKRGQTPITLAHNSYVLEVLKKPTTYTSLQRSFFKIPITESKNTVLGHQAKGETCVDIKESDTKIKSERVIRKKSDASLVNTGKNTGRNMKKVEDQAPILSKNKNDKECRVKQRLISAIMDGDVCLANYYLACDDSTSSIQPRENNCHPLCDCQHCCLLSDE